MTRTQIPVYLTAEDVAKLDARRQDRSRSAYLRHLLLRDAEPADNPSAILEALSERLPRS